MKHTSFLFPSDLSVRGPPSLQSFFDAAGHFLALDDFSVVVPRKAEGESDRPYEDVTVRVDPVELSYRGPEVWPAQSK